CCCPSSFCATTIEPVPAIMTTPGRPKVAPKQAVWQSLTTRVRSNGSMPRHNFSFSAFVASENSAAQPTTNLSICVFGGSCRSSDSLNFFKLRRAVGRPAPKKFSEPASAVANILPVESTAMAKLCVPPPSMPMKTGSVRFISVEEWKGDEAPALLSGSRKAYYRFLRLHHEPVE